MKKFKKGDKVTIRDINDVKKKDYGMFNLLDIHYEWHIITTLNNIKNNYGIFQSKEDGNCYITDPKSDNLCYVEQSFVYPYQDVSLDNKLFELE